MMHVSTAGSVELIRRAKGRGVRVTTEVCPHHFTLTDECLRTFDSNFKMSPPLRTQARRRGLHRRAGRRHDRRDLHRPRAACAGKENARARPGPVRHRGAGNVLGAGRSRSLIEPGHLDWPTRPGQDDDQPGPHSGHQQGTLAIGADADITIIDPACEWTYDVNHKPLEEPQLAVPRCRNARPRRNGDRRRRGEISGRLDSLSGQIF